LTYTVTTGKNTGETQNNAIMFLRTPLPLDMGGQLCHDRWIEVTIQRQSGYGATFFRSNMILRGQAMSEKEKFRILSIDGGGIRGIIPAQVLVSVEELLRKKTGNNDVRIAEHFDLIAGTSTGGILTCIHLCPGLDGEKPAKSKFIAEDAVNLYKEQGEKIFNPRRRKWHTTVMNWLRPKYPSTGIEEVLNDYLGDLRLNELLKPCLITAYDVKTRKTVFFTQHNAIQKNRNPFVREVARATSAAPTYFPPALVGSVSDSSNEKQPLIDGAVFANNPSMCAFAEARNKFAKKVSDIVMLSLGTGYSHKDSYDNSQTWGCLRWAVPVLDIMMTGVSETVDYQMRQLFGSVGCLGPAGCLGCENQCQYLRVNTNLSDSQFNASTAMDDVSGTNIQALIDLGASVADKYSSKIASFVNRYL